MRVREPLRSGPRTRLQAACARHVQLLAIHGYTAREPIRKRLRLHATSGTGDIMPSPGMPTGERRGRGIRLWSEIAAICPAQPEARSDPLHSESAQTMWM